MNLTAFYTYNFNAEIKTQKNVVFLRKVPL